MEVPGDLLEAVMGVKSKMYSSTTETVLAVTKEVVPGEVTEGISRAKLLVLLEGYLRDIEKEEEHEALIVKLEKLFVGAVPSSTTGTGIEDKTTASTLWRKDFKIYGQISESNGLSFVSLQRQIEAGVAKGFKSSEIVEGVIRAINPNLRLRSYLEGRPELSLPTLRSIIRSHFKEKTHTELYQQLCNLCQGPKEEAIDFLMRALDLRQMVMFAATESSDVPYDSTLVQSMFAHALYTGFRTETIRHEMKPFLTKTTSDEELISVLNSVVSKESEHSVKIRVGKASVSGIESVSVTTPSSHTEVAKDTKPPKERKLAVELRELRGEVAELRTRLSNNVTGGTTKTGAYGRKNQQHGCVNCQANGTGEACRHCFRCGGDDHFKIGCRRPRLSGNENGSFQRGQE